MRKFLITLIRFYSVCISSVTAPCCRFHPSCAGYAEQAIRDHGTRRGCMLIFRRLLRCHPFHPGGFDPVPPAHRDCQGRTN